jgi:Family of unknown function (DUF5343)
MADKHPYAPGTGGLTQAVSQFRNMFPTQVTAETLRKLSIAPNNESYVINVLRYIGLIDSEGKKTSDAAAVFSKHDDAEFQSALSKLVERSYASLFELHGELAWNLSTDKLISFFRNSDQTSSIVGQRQAGIFHALASLSGHTTAPTAKSPATRAKASGSSAQAPKKMPAAKVIPREKDRDKNPHAPQGVALSMRVEINLPIASDQETYDRIFRSIKENLLNG